MSFLEDATQETIDKEILFARFEYDIKVYEAQILDSKRKLCELKKSEFVVRGMMSEAQGRLDTKKAEYSAVR